MRRLIHAAQHRWRVQARARVNYQIVVLFLFWRDRHLVEHGDAVGRALLRLAPDQQAAEWYWAGLLHDLGKIGLPRALWRKTAPLTRDDWSLIRQHPIIGARWLQRIGAPAPVIQGAYFHHERWDGSGYPHDIGGDEIPALARALAIADVYVAMIEHRPYRAAHPEPLARAFVENHAGSLFDPQMVELFFSRLERTE